ncbi:hypothetical protein ACRALDRAFT_1072775 [Sodiomyces alcalophilus JCM 7366]|uniref:uncharacterized protein n=1 Tax=Sodiomyces alcalophilus JCM 7366 TaxID=591952 RepID=UPI0039B4FE6E
MERSQESSNLLDTHNRLIADILARFRMLTMLATIQSEGESRNIDAQTIAVTGMSMQLEFEGLSTSVKDLLALSRRLKELWLFGRLGGEDEQAKAQAEQLDRDVVRCAELVNSIQAKRYASLASENGGSWEPLVEMRSDAAEGGAGAGAGGVVGAGGGGTRAAPTPTATATASTAPSVTATATATTTATSGSSGTT